MSMMFDRNNFPMPDYRKWDMIGWAPWGGGRPPGPNLNREVANAVILAEKKLEEKLNKSKSGRKKQKGKKSGPKNKVQKPQKVLTEESHTAEESPAVNEVTYAGRERSTVKQENGRFRNAFPGEGQNGSLTIQEAVVWSEILGEPVSRRRRRRVNQQNGDQGYAYRR